jgi:ATP/maltotriose-dependent transcriptional regulator MalT
MTKEVITPSLRFTCPPCGEVFAAQSEEILIDMAVEHARKFHDINLLDEFSHEELRQLVERENESYWSRIAHLIPNGRLRTVLQEKLCDREREIVSYVVHGFANREIAGRLFISQRTVSTHLVNIYEKLNVHSRAELTALVRASDRIIEAALRAGTEPEFGPFVQAGRPRRRSRSRSAERA